MSEPSILVEDNISFLFTTNNSLGGVEAPLATFGNFIRVYKDQGTSTRTSQNGMTISSSFDSISFLHRINIDTSDDTDVGFWEEGSKYIVMFGPSTTTVDSQTVGAIIGRFEILSNAEITGLYQGEIWYDSAAANTNSRFGVDGVLTNKISNDTAALALVNSSGNNVVNVEGTLTLTQVWKNKATFQGNDLDSIVQLNNTDSSNNVFRNIVVAGSFLNGDEKTVFADCVLTSVSNLGGIARNSIYDGTHTMGDSGVNREFIDYFGSSLDAQTSINFNGADRKASFINWSGDLLITDMNTVSANLNIVLNGGKLTLDATCAAGNVTVSGIGEFVDNSTGTTVLQDGLGVQHWSGASVKGVGANMIENDGGNNKRWTAKALEQAPDTIGGDATLANQTLILNDTNAIKVKTDNLPGTIKKNTAFNNYTFVMLDETTEAPATGLTITAERAIDGAAFVAMTNSASEISAGAYKINISADDTNGDFGMWKFSSPGAKVAFTGFTTET